MRDIPARRYRPRFAPLPAHLDGLTAMAMTPFRNEPPFEGAAVLDGVARRVVGDIHNFFSKERLERAATQDERVRLAHELHDGLLQSLTGIALQLQVVSRLLDGDPDAARGRLRDVQALLAVEQQELRAWITNVSPTMREATATTDDVAFALQQLCRRAEWQWRVRCELIVGERGSIPRTLADHVYRIVQEGLNNVGRHARAQAARVELSVKTDRVDIIVSDDGVGFPFHGRYDLAKLTARRLGPRSLKERIASLRGRLVLTSGMSGSELQIALPLQRHAWPRPIRSLASH